MDGVPSPTPERCPSGRRSAPGKRVIGYSPVRGFKSLSLRQLENVSVGSPSQRASQPFCPSNRNVLSSSRYCGTARRKLFQATEKISIIRYYNFESMATIGENIKKYRTKLGITQDDLVRKSDVKHTTLTKIESDFVKKAERSNHCQNRQSGTSASTPDSSPSPNHRSEQFQAASNVLMRHCAYATRMDARDPRSGQPPLGSCSLPLPLPLPLPEPGLAHRPHVIADRDGEDIEHHGGALAGIDAGHEVPARHEITKPSLLRGWLTPVHVERHLALQDAGRATVVMRVNR